MRVRYIPAAVTLTAGAITCITSIIKGDEVIESLIRILVVLLVFYIIGIIAREAVRYALNLGNSKTSEGQDENAAPQSELEKGTQETEGNSTLGEKELES